MRVMVTGAEGMLGRAVVARLAPKHDVVGVDIGDFDITDHAAAEAAIAAARPDLVCHCAAYTDVDGCEREPDRAFRVNALGTWNTASACSAAGANMIYISTDFVFDGDKGEPYSEYDAPRPLGAYGASKLAGERHVRELVQRHFIVRTAWLFAEHGHNFVLSILRKAQELAAAAVASGGAPVLRVVADQIGSPTYARDLADAIARHIVDSHLYGTYHITNAGSCSWAEFAAEALRYAGSPAQVEPISWKDWPSPTRRPAYAVLRHLSLELQGRDDIRPWQEALAETVARTQLGGDAG
ncbi:MAG: dTDP-4-dehydrorhamnose reductase [Armatimonadota bacterium]|nr:MAG: dTDP-4-dehydrorhamnose reductase [Armatimonadota bacterium]